MNSISTEGFAVTVNLPRSYLGRAELRVSPDSVTLVARPIRHYRAIVLSYSVAVLVLIGAALAIPGQLELEIRAVLVGVIAGVLAGGMYWLLFSSGGDPRSMALPLTSVSLVKHKGRVLMLSAAFESGARSSRWTLAAGNRGDANAIASALTADDG